MSDAPRSLDPLRLRLSGLQLIEASAGTGKTYTITTLVLRLVLERGIGIERILVVTFTRAATAELRRRVRSRLRDTHSHLIAGTLDAEHEALVAAAPTRELARLRLQAALHHFDEAAIFTIHGYCQRVLSELAFESSVRFDVELVSDATPLLVEVATDFLTKERYAASPARVDALGKRGVDLASLVSLGREVTSNPDLLVESPVPPPEPDAALSRYVALREQLKEGWAAKRSSVEAVLAQASLKQNSYRPKQIAESLEELRRALVDPAPTVPTLKAALRLHPRTLKERVKKGKPAPEHSVLTDIGELLDAQQAALQDLEYFVADFRLRYCREVAKELGHKKTALGVQSFDDLLTTLRSALNGPGGDALAARLLLRYPAALIDEFQDTDPVQYQVFTRIYREPTATLLLIGDPKQAIYAFRGADVFAYLDAARQAGEARHTLDTSYRADPGLLAAQNALYSRVTDPFEFPEIQYHPVEPRPSAKDELGGGPRPLLPLEFAFVERTDQQKLINKRDDPRERVASDIVALLASDFTLQQRPIAPGDIAVLTRTNQQAAELQTALRLRGVPAVLLGDKSVFDTPEAAEMALLLSALADPRSAVAVRSALSTAALGLSAADLVALREERTVAEAMAWEGWLQRFERWHALWRDRGFMAAFRALASEADVAVRLLGLQDGERRLTNLMHLAELLHQTAAERHLGVAGLLRFYAEAHSDKSKRDTVAPDAQQLRLESDSHAVHLTTMHRSKGLEYPIVYLPYLWHGATLRTFEEEHLRFHDPERAGRAVLRIVGKREKDERESDPYRQRAEFEVRAEAARLGYVALTRAKHQVTCVWGAFKTADSSPLGRLLLQSKDSAEAPAQRLRRLSDDGLQADLAALNRDSGGAAGARPLAEASDERLTQVALPAAPLTARPLSRRMHQVWRSSSFSALSRGADVTVSRQVSEGRDVDAVAGTEATATPSPADSAVLLASFPRGARAGECLHRILELVDFRREDPTELSEVSGTVLRQYGYDATRWTDVVSLALGAVLDTPLRDEGDLRLAHVPRSKRVSEMAFIFPVSPAQGAFSASRLAECFEGQNSSKVPQGYVAELRRLPFAPLVGSMRGFIDLVFEHEGRTYVVDFKSNHLGDTGHAYTDGALSAEMTRHHYFLQYHLYAVALHRYLALRVRDYDYERHFGGVLYLFLRGMDPVHPGRAVFFDRPDSAMLERLSLALGGTS